MTSEEFYGLPGYQNQIIQSPLDMSNSHSFNTIPSLRDYIISEDLLAGQRLNGRMSSVRRFFCLFVTFDFLFISLMWLICVMLNGQNILDALKVQILHYNIHTSLFDIVLVAFCRFLLLILCYAILNMNHWIIISISTALSCTFLISKVLEFDWPKSSQPVIEVLLVLASFVLSWGEAWFLDCRVIPQETNANRYLITATESERAPLIRNYIQNLPSAYSESERNFYSPMASPEGSLYHVQTAENNVVIPPAEFTVQQEDYYRIQGMQNIQILLDLHRKEDWRLEKQQDQTVIYSRKDPNCGTIFKMMTLVDAPPHYMFDSLYSDVGNLAKWNSAVKESHKIQAIDENTDITYQISHTGAGGLVSSREFVNLRHWTRVDDTIIIIGCMKCDHPEIPKGKKYVRGENGVGGYILESIPNDENKCNFGWILNVHLNVLVPRIILNREIMKMMLVFAKDLKNHINNDKGNNKTELRKS